MAIFTDKYFRKFEPEEIFTEYIFSLMKQRKDLMVFVDNNQVLIDEEIDEWNKVNGITNKTERLMYHCFGNDGYVVNYTEGITNVTAPFDTLEMSYEEFIKQCKEDLKSRLE